MRYQAPKGTHDVLPGEAHRWRTLERTFGELAERFGYREVRTPAFEETDLFVRSSGDTSEIVTKQMYTFLDKKGRSLTLKPEGTAPAIRAYLEHGLGGQGSTTRLWYLTQVFRYEQPQKGRYRQSHQVGLELLGSGSPAADAEVVELTVRFFEAMGLRDLRVLVNSIGRAETRRRYGEVLIRHFEPILSEFDVEARARAQKNPLRLLDSKDPRMAEAIQNAPIIGDYLEDASRAGFEELLCRLAEANVHVEIAPRIVRGLDYYTDTVFEVQSGALGSQNSLCGGGRYDGLVEQMGGPPTPAVGVGIGVERVLMVQEAMGLASPAPGVDVYVVAATDSARATVATLARGLREAGLSCLHDLDGRSMKSQLKHADRAQARFAALVGDDELAKGIATLRNLETGEQTEAALDRLAEALRA